MAEEKHILDEIFDALCVNGAEAPAAPAPAPSQKQEAYKSPDLAEAMTNHVDRIVEAIDEAKPQFPIGTPAIKRSAWKSRRAEERGEIKPSTT